MSTALVAAGRLKPEIRLAQAVSEFENDLTSEQKAAFRVERSRTSSSSPTVKDVMQLTAEINLRNARGNRCFGPRFTNVLHAVQKFASIGDVVVGGSQNLLACGVWSVVRMSLLAIPKTVSTLERLSALFMAVGRSAPRHEKLATLYPRSRDLHNQLFEYYIVLVKLCHEIVKTSRKSTIGQLISPVNESVLTSYQSSLEQYAVSIGDEVRCLIAQKVESESVANSRFRELSTYFSSTATSDLRLRKRERALDVCSTYDYEAAWKRHRKLGRATIYQNNATYSIWRDNSQASTLVITGKLGSGKSVLMANIVDDLCLTLSKSNAIVTYFFCDWNTVESLTAKTILGSLVRQTINSLQDSATLDKAFDKFLKTRASHLNTLEPIEMLHQILAKDRPIYFVLDGLGDCPSAESLQVQKVLTEITSHFNLHLCISRRKEAESIMKNVDVLEFTIPSNDNHDIEQFISSELERCIENGKLMLGNPELVLEIHDALEKGADGMMLWVSLQIQSLCLETNDSAIRKSLKNLPRSLSEIFARISRASEDLESGRHKQQLFILVLASLRPLNLSELQEALSVEPGNSHWDQEQLINDKDTILSGFNGLLISDEEDQTVRFVHPSFKQYLTVETDQDYSHLNVHRSMADIVVTYLSYPIFEQQVIRPNAQMEVQSMPRSIVQTALPAGISRSLALRLLRQKRTGSVDVGKTLLPVNSKQSALSGFFAYAKANLRYHAWAYILQPNPKTQDLLFKCLSYGSSFDSLHKGGMLMEIIESIYWDSDAGLQVLLELTRDKTSQVDWYSYRYRTDKSGVSLWTWALKLGYTDILRSLLLNSPLNTEPLPRHRYDDSLVRVHEILQHGHLQLAAESLLRDTSGRLDRSLPLFSDRTLLQMAVLNVYPESRSVVDLLLQYKAQPEWASPSMPSSFFLALSLQQWDIAERFLSAGAAIDHVDGRGQDMIANLCQPQMRDKAIAWLIQHGANADKKEHRHGEPGKASSDHFLMLLESSKIPEHDPPVGELQVPFRLNSSHRKNAGVFLLWQHRVDMSTEKAVRLTEESIELHRRAHRSAERGRFEFEDSMHTEDEYGADEV